MTAPTVDHAWVDIDTSAFRYNIATLSAMASAKGKEFMVIVKANAYGHGLVPMAQEAGAAGAKFLGVGNIEEALTLREQGVAAPIMLFTEPPAGAVPLLSKHHITVVVGSFTFLEQLGNMAARRQPPFHIKINTGLNRFGFRPADVPRVVGILKRYSIQPEGILTHYTAADSSSQQTKQEYGLFRQALTQFTAAGATLRYIHASNSAATAWHDEQETNLVRLGLACYGLQPNPARPLPLRPVLSWHTRLAAIARIEAGEGVSYGGKWRASRPSTIGIIPAGYSDGLRRGPQNQQEVLIRRTHFPIIGNVMMNHAIIDITDAGEELQVGDIATLLGSQGNSAISAEQTGERIDTINEEVVTTISPLLHRYYR